MTQQEVINSNYSKTKKAFLLFELGYTRRDVANWITNNNYGFAHNIWKKWNEQRTPNNIEQPLPTLPFEFQFNRSFGIELEIYGPTRELLIEEFRKEGIVLVSQTYNHNTTTDWKIVSDGSVSGTNANEIVSPILLGTNGLEQIKKVCLALNRSKAQVNTTCGFHVHFGANDFAIENFKALALNHIALEHNFDSIQPLSRRENSNSYCKSLTVIANTKAASIQKINSATTINDLLSKFVGRYYKLNFQSFTRQGTIEFRHHSGTVQFSKIRNWVLLCARLMEYSKTNGLVNNINNITNESLQDYINDRAVDLAA